MNKIQWTPPQAAAIKDRGGSLLLSAAAGSGKTAVLVERVVDLLQDDNNPVSLSQLLVVTFSNAAAAEMRQRIGVRLAGLMTEQPENYHLHTEYNLLSGAPIRTIHAYCMNLISEHFQVLSLPPDFTIMEEKELALLKGEIGDACLEDFYSKDNKGDFQDLVELLSTGRDDQRFLETVFKIYSFARSHPFYESWLNEKLQMYDPTIPAGETVWGISLLGYTRETLEYTLHLLNQSREWLLGDPVLEKAYLPSWDSDIAQIKNILDYIYGGDWDGAVGALRGLTFMRLGSVRGEDEVKERAKQARDQSKKLLSPLSERYLNATEKEFQQDIKVLRPQIKLLFDFVKEFDQRLSEAKLQEKKLDFSDLEHYALRLLVSKEKEGYIITPLGGEIASQFQHVLVDEYQDTNEVQDLIFYSLSEGGKRLFMVGDVKQSIYSFRLAMPEIFMQKKEAFYPYDFEHPRHPVALNLDTNFRSRLEVTQGINYIFSQIMSKKMGEVDYNEAESLKCGAAYPENSLMTPELILLNGEGWEGDYTELEAEAVAEKIKSLLVQKILVTQGGELRPVTPSDFCILLRSPKGRGQAYVKALGQLDILAQSDSQGVFFKAREISVMVSLLKALDNPLLDIQLAAVMRSPLFNFSNDDLARLHLSAPSEHLYTGVAEGAAEGDIECQKLIGLFTHLRYYGATHSADQLLLEIYRQTHWLELASAMPYGAGREKNLLLLVEYARYYHNMGYKGHHSFTALLHRLEERGEDLAGASGAGEGENVVQILSVHKSKGLEFPIVILADTGRQFNRKDLYQPTLLHSEYGFACVNRNPETLSQYPTIPMGAIRLEMEKTMLSEEMRILYVALTRAKEKLIITGTIRRNFKATVARQHLPLSKGKLPSFLVGGANSYLDWLLMSLIHHPQGEDLRQAGDLEEVELLDTEAEFGITILNQFQQGEREEEQQKKLWMQAPNKELAQLLIQRTSFEYPYINDTLLPNKLAVSQLASQEQSKAYRFSRRPHFLSSKSLTPTEQGNALHKFMQFSDYEKGRDDLEAEISRMVKEAYLSLAEGDSLNRESLNAFFGSPLAGRIFASPKVHRELRFITQFGKSELGELLPLMDNDSKVVLQGVADCVFIEEGQGVIVDYKTDRVATMDELTHFYQKQILLYRGILEETLGLPIKEGLLYSFHLSEQRDVLADT